VVTMWSQGETFGGQLFVHVTSREYLGWHQAILTALVCTSSVGSNTTAGSGKLIVFEYSQWGLV